MLASKEFIEKAYLIVETSLLHDQLGLTAARQLRDIALTYLDANKRAQAKMSYVVCDLIDGINKAFLEAVKDDGKVKMFGGKQ